MLKKISPFTSFNTKQAHGFHLVLPSFLPFLSGMGILFVLMQIVCYLHNINFWIFNLNPIFYQLIFIGIVLYWFTSIVVESFEGFHTIKVQNGLQFGMVLFIVSEIMLFFAFFWAFFHFSIAPATFIGQTWPPITTQEINIFDLILPVVNTILLLSSGITITLAHDYILKNKNYQFTFSLFLTILLGIIFLICQANEYNVGLAFSWKEDIFGAGFYITTGFHGLHVTIGTLFLIYCLIRAGYSFFGHDWLITLKRFNYNFTISIYKFIKTNILHYFKKFPLLQNWEKSVLEISKNGPYQIDDTIYQEKDCAFLYNQHLGFEAAAWYWHFVDVVWLFLFITIYWWGLEQNSLLLHFLIYIFLALVLVVLFYNLYFYFYRYK